MGTNNSKLLKVQYENGQYQETGSFRDSQLNETRNISIRSENGRNYPCMLRKLDTEKYTQTFSKVDDFIQKMNKTSPFISSFLFISEAHQQANVFGLIFESGHRRLTYSQILPVSIKILFSVISALEFLEDIQLFYPHLHLGSILEMQDRPGTFKLINQFCFSDFLDFITQVYLSERQTPAKLKRVLEEKRSMNMMQLQAMVTQVVEHHPQLRQSPHAASNLVLFDLFLREAVKRKMPYRQIKRKFEELFDVESCTNRGHDPKTPLSQSAVKQVLPLSGHPKSFLNRQKSSTIAIETN